MFEYNIKTADYYDRIEFDEKCPFKPVMGASSCIDKENNVAYLFGGSDYKKYNPVSLFKFDLNNKKFEIIDQLDIKPMINHNIFYSKNKIYIVGGLNPDFMNRDDYFRNDIIEYDLLEQKMNRLISEDELLKRGRPGVSFDEKRNKIYIYGGFGKSDFLIFDLKSNVLKQIVPEGTEPDKRAVMAAEMLPDGKLFIFSGFTNTKGCPICYNDYYIYDPDKNQLIKKECNELIGRSAAKSFVYEEENKVIIFGGSPNGMEISRALYFYDINKDVFNIFYMQDLVQERIEPAHFFSEKLKKLYIISGGCPSYKNMREYEFLKDIIIVDFNKITNEAWIGHP